MGKYYSKRDKPLSDEITQAFWRAFKAYIDEIIDAGWLRQSFGSRHFSSEFGDYWVNIEEDRLKRKMLQDLGRDLYPFPINVPLKDSVFDFIEFFFNHISIPKDDFEFDATKAKYQYTIRINNFFDNFNIGYKLRKGAIAQLHSTLIDKQILYDKFNIPDKETENLLNLAVNKFYSRNITEQKIGLEKLVDVFQRISSWEDKDKKKSVDKILDKTSSGDLNIKEALECPLNTLWKIANKFMIRHTEVGKIPISDNDFREYLFYSYYNCIRLILIKYKCAKTAPTEEEDIPF